MRIVQSMINYLLAVSGLIFILMIGNATVWAQSTIPVPDAQSTPAQSLPATASASTSSTSSLERQFFKNILRDQQAIWTSPFHLHREDAKWVVPAGIGAAALIATDHETAEQIGDNVTRLSVSRWVSRGGVGYTTGGLAGGFYLIGRL